MAKLIMLLCVSVLSLIQFSVAEEDKFKLLQAKLVATESITEEYDWALTFFRNRATEDKTGESQFFISIIELKKCLAEGANCSQSELDNIVDLLTQSSEMGNLLSISFLEFCYREGFLVEGIDTQKADEFRELFALQESGYTIEAARQAVLKTLNR